VMKIRDAWECNGQVPNWQLPRKINDVPWPF
jgi:hypothetical protein